MAQNRKPKKTTKKRTVRKRRPRKVEQLSKLETHYVTLNEMYKAAIAAGFNKEVAFWLITEPGVSVPDWIIPNKPNEVIPRIDQDDDED